MGLGPSRSESIWKHPHTKMKSEGNGIDPDDGNSWKCSACNLPIFSTPFININMKRGRFLVHDQCDNLPKILMDHVLHSGEPLTLKEAWDPSTRDNYYCDKCSNKCGRMMYQCLDSSCDVRLDLLCSLQMKILHRSHQHRLMAIRGPASFSCGACGTQHQGRVSAPISYLCTACDFWIHTDCASAPNAIKLVHHRHHDLFLTYHLAASSAAADYDEDDDCKCAICGEEILLNLGAYICIKCRYYAHIRCATSDRNKFKPVLIRDAKLADLLHLPMADEGSSIVQYMLENTSVGDDNMAAHSGDGHQLIFHHDDAEEEEEEEEEEHEEKKDEKEEEKKDEEEEDEEKEDEGEKDEEEEEEEELHGHDLRHLLILHDEDDEDDDDLDSDDDDGTGHSSSRVCNACVQFISGRPFYSCSQCPGLLLHTSCAKLPTKIQHPLHQEHALFLSTNVLGLFSTLGFDCEGCNRTCSGFAYTCTTCGNFSMDVLCALMPASITHASHGKTHILSMSPSLYSGGSCSCCNLDLKGVISYECTNCRHLKLHAHCALLPTTITHSFDVHPLNLTTTSLITNDDVDDSQQICEVCEEDIKEMCWYYSCNYCDQSFHINCIPFLDSHSRIKFGVSVYTKIHHCPLTLVRENTLSGYYCDLCKDKFECKYNPREVRCAYECSKCNYRIHEICVFLRS